MTINPLDIKETYRIPGHAEAMFMLSTEWEAAAAIMKAGYSMATAFKENRKHSVHAIKKHIRRGGVFPWNEMENPLPAEFVDESIVGTLDEEPTHNRAGEDRSW